MSNIFEEMLRRGEKGGVLTTQEFLQGVTEPSRPQLVKRTNPITNVLEKKFTQGQDDEPLVLVPEERAARSDFKYGGTIAQQLGQQEVAKRALAEKLAEALKSDAPKQATDAAKDSASDAKGAAISAGANLAAGMAGGTGTTAGGALSGAGTGFAIGGPVGAGIGAVAGGIAGGMKAKAAKKQRKQEAEAAAYKNIANIAQQTGQNRNVGIQNIMQAFQNAFNRGR